MMALHCSYIAAADACSAVQVLVCATPAYMDQRQYKPTPGWETGQQHHAVQCLNGTSCEKSFIVNNSRPIKGVQPEPYSDDKLKAPGALPVRH